MESIDQNWRNQPTNDPNEIKTFHRIKNLFLDKVRRAKFEKSLKKKKN